MTRPPQCVECALAKWQRTAAGRLHPSGDGLCGWKMPEIRLPVSMYFFGNPKPYGGHINRRDQWRQCPFFRRAKP